MKKVLPFIIVLLLIAAVGGSLAWQLVGKKYMPTSDIMDYASELGLADDECTIMLNNELLDDRAKVVDDRVYLPFDLVRKNVNTRFYWDANESVCLYTTPTQILVFTPDEESYAVRAWDGETDGDEGYTVVKTIGDTLYIAAEYVKANTCMDYGEYTDPGRIVINTSWDEEEVVTVSSGTAIRYKGGIKGEVLREAESGEEMVVVDAYDDWTNVATEDGYIGWVATDAIRTDNTITKTAPDFDAPEYTSIQKDYKINMAWHQVMSKSANSDVASTLASAPGINTISPTWFHFTDTDGTIGCIATEDYVTTCHNQDIEVWALFSNEFTQESSSDRVFDSDKTNEVLSYTSKRQTVIEQVIDYVLQYDIDGINIDFEAITQDGADDYIEFIRELSIACRYNGIVLSVDNYVPEYTYYYNRKEQGIVCDYVVIMGYDETTAGSDTPGPVASQSFVRQGIEDTLALVDKSKVINGIPFYTRVWSTDASGNVSSFACGMDEALGYLTGHDAEVTYSESEGLNYGSYTSTKDGNLYEIWLQDADAVKDEMKLIKSNDLAGVAEWKLGFESGTDIWKIISKYLK